ncbi:hypothetical protein FNV43_RR16035 [Rhamnella rubrinervis]|uniref:ABC transporter domain-containing protein n=1 Tax=Rhamnella rubrinervis TaxID=2594499 RepID=A0A8K0GX92_9ROSA|nr:hypothetical protein FNV43_RR16035 [Rhamnella rubrinervis]
MEIDVEAQSNPDSTIFKNANRLVILEFEDVVYKIKTNNGGLIKKDSKCEEKMILKGLTGVIKPGEMLAMLGPSGSGKTTLLTTLGGRHGGGGRLSGNITYNGKPLSNAMKRNIGFVTQDDVLCSFLTVAETLAFTALLRLPNNLTKDQKILQAEAVVDQLGLTKCKNSIIGGPFLRGISGGERKRVSIGQEMLTNPSLLLLDEPTSGLDSTTAQKIVCTLWQLASRGRTVVMTIHQPSSRVFYMFQKVLLLSEGNTLYFGNGAEVMDYFARIGFAPSVAMNPSDFLLDLANGLTPGDSHEDQNLVKQGLITAYKRNLADNVKAELQEINLHQPHDEPEDKTIGEWPTTWFQQFSVLLKRGVKERRFQAFSGLKIGQVLTIAVLSGLLWWQSSHLQDKIGLLFFMSGFWGFFPVSQAVFTFPQERKILAKERASGMYRLSAYFISRIAADLPMELSLPTVFLTIAYWMAGLKATAGHFFLTLFVLLLSVLVSQGLGLALGAVVMDQRSATTLGAVIMMAFLLSGGFYVQNVPGFIAWIKYVSISHYTYKLFLGSQYSENETYLCYDRGGSRMCMVGEYPAIKQVGLGGQAISMVAMFLMLVGYRMIAYIALMRIGVTKV